MPSPSPPSSKREQLARFVSRLRSNRTAGSPLLVQTGFPTSLADLVVKNRAKLFKKRKKLPQLENIDLIEEVSDDRGGLGVESPNVVDGEVEVLGVERRGGRGGLELGFWVVKVAALGVLAVGGKWVVVGITILAFGLLGLEIFGVLKPRSKDRNVVGFNAVEIINRDHLEIGMGGFRLRGRELVSPIREIESNDSRSDSIKDHLKIGREGFNLRGRELVSPLKEIDSNSSRSDSTCSVSMERRDFYAVDNVGKDQDLGNSRKSKRKKLLRKLFRRKNRKKKDVEESSSCLDERTSSHEEVLIESKEIRDEEYFSFEDTNEVIEIKTGDVDVIRDNWGEIRLGRWRKLVFFVVILIGLLGGKGLALVLTVACYLLSVCTGTVWKKWKMR